MNLNIKKYELWDKPGSTLDHALWYVMDERVYQRVNGVMWSKLTLRLQNRTKQAMYRKLKQ